MSRLLFLSIGSFWIAVSITTAAIAGTKSAPPLVTLLADCKPGTACLSAAVVIENLEKRQVGFLEGTCGWYVISARGRLNGGPVKTYRVGFAANCMDCTNNAYAAFIGTSAGNPVFVSTAGRFEFLSKGITVGNPDALYIIHARTGKIVTTYWGSTYPGGVFHVTKDGKAFVSDETSNTDRCFVATRATPKALTPAPGRCHSSEAAEMIDVYEPPGAVAKTLSAIGQPYRAYTIPGSELINVVFGDSCS